MAGSPCVMYMEAAGDKYGEDDSSASTVEVAVDDGDWVQPIFVKEFAAQSPTNLWQPLCFSPGDFRQKVITEMVAVDDGDWVQPFFMKAALMAPTLHPELLCVEAAGDKYGEDDSSASTVEESESECYPLSPGSASDSDSDVQLMRALSFAAAGDRDGEDDSSVSTAEGPDFADSADESAEETDVLRSHVEEMTKLLNEKLILEAKLEESEAKLKEVEQRDASRRRFLEGLAKAAAKDPNQKPLGDFCRKVELFVWASEDEVSDDVSMPVLCSRADGLLLGSGADCAYMGLDAQGRELVVKMFTPEAQATGDKDVDDDSSASTVEASIEIIEDEIFEAKVERECAAVGLPKHESVVKSFGVARFDEVQNMEGMTVKSPIAFSVMEFLRGDSLFNVLRGLQAKSRWPSEHDLRPIMRQLVEALRHLHENGAVHLDIKLENIMLVGSDLTGDGFRKAKVVIIDFGCSSFEDRVEGQAHHGYYVAPEHLLWGLRQHQGEPCPSPDEKADVWSFGALLYGLLVGVPPFGVRKYGMEMRWFLMRQCAGEAIPKDPQGADKRTADDDWRLHPTFRKLSRPAKDLVAKLLKFRPRERLSMEEALDHEWVRGPSDC